jgi:hypothetical protein
LDGIRDSSLLQKQFGNCSGQMRGDPTGAEARTSLTHQPMKPLHKEVPVLLACHAHSHIITYD